MKVLSLAMAATLSLAAPTFAQTATCGIFSGTLQRTGRQVYVRPGVTAIEFNPVRESIRHVELSNLEKVSVNFDADLDSGFATTIFLRPISGLSIPHLPSGPTTEMLVMTQDRQGIRKTYPFRLVYQAGERDCSVLSIYPDTQGLPLVELTDRRRVPVEYVSMGLEVAARDESMPYDNPLRQRVRNFLALVQNGESVANASHTAGVSLSVIQQLAQKGYDGYQSGSFGLMPASEAGSNPL